MAEPSKNYFQDHAYRLFPPEAEAETVDWKSGIQLSEIEINCVITTPAGNSVISGEEITVQGFAISGGGKEIERVEVSANGGKTWIEATISNSGHPWAWTFWEARLTLPEGEHQIVARAYNSVACTQPEHPHQVWNFKGYMNNSFHRIQVKVKGNP